MPSSQHEGHPLSNVAKRDTWVDQAIREAQERGEFDNLAGSGQPLDLSVNPHGQDWESGFRALKNAGMAPYWIELDKSIRAEAAALAAFLERTAAFLSEATRAVSATAPAAPQPAGGWRARLRRVWVGPRRVPAVTGWTVAGLEVERRRARAEYLQRAAELDKQIVELNASLPKELWWKERPRLTPEQAAATFDAACPRESAGGSAATLECG
jgi:hypothetical protein